VDGKKILALTGIAFLIFFVVHSPTDAAIVVRSIGHGIGHGFERMSEFIQKL
jgi:hypothetical protein